MRSVPLLISFCVNGYFPSAMLVQGTDGNIWGTTYYGEDLSNAYCGNGCGTIFEITPSGTLTTLHTFEEADGGGPPLLQSTNGAFYGTTQLGGSEVYGTVFRLATGLGPFVEADPLGGKVGAQVIITGTNLTGITAVTFNGTSASFTVAAKTEVIANVPAGATTGFIQVTTSSGTLKSNAPFRVIP